MVTKSLIENKAVLKVDGDLDVDNFPQLLKRAEEAFDEGRTQIVIDLKGVSHISTGGMIALQTISARAESRGGKIQLVGATGSLKR